MCQSVLRLVLATKEASCRRHERRMSSAVKIQALWRTHFATEQFKCAISKATLLQSLVRRWTARRNFVQHKWHATVIQAVWRCSKQKKLFAETVRTVILIQSIIRSWNSRLHFIQKMKDIIVCQSVVRRRNAMEEFKLMVSAHFIEQQWISFLRGKDLVNIRPHLPFIRTIPGAWLVLVNMAATKIQSLWRARVTTDTFKRVVRGES